MQLLSSCSAASKSHVVRKQLHRAVGVYALRRVDQPDSMHMATYQSTTTSLQHTASRSPAPPTQPRLPQTRTTPAHNRSTRTHSPLFAHTRSTSSCPHTLYARPYQLCARTSSALLITHHPHHLHHPHAPRAHASHASHASHSQRAIEDPEHEPMRRPNSYLPWRSDGRCSDYDMTTGLDLSRMGYLQVWELRTSKSIPSLRLLLHHDQSSPTLT